MTGDDRREPAWEAEHAAGFPTMPTYGERWFCGIPECPVPGHGGDTDPGVCGDVPWCGLPAGHELSAGELGGGHRVTADGVYDIPADIYHSDVALGESLSSTGVKLLLPPKCPALYAYDRQHGRPDKDVFDFGHAAHRRVLGVGPELAVIPPNPKSGAWDTNDLKAEVAAARAAGSVPLKPSAMATIEAMADALRRHELAPLLFSDGHAERAMFWTDDATGVTRRTMLDWLPDPPASGRMIAADYKSVASAAPGDLRRAMWNFGWYRQSPWCLDGIEALGLAEPGEARFVFVCQEKTPPYLVTPFEPDTTALLIGHRSNRQAIGVYADCTRIGRWPDYVGYEVFLRTGRWPDADEVLALALPGWAEREQLQEMSDS